MATAYCTRCTRTAIVGSIGHTGSSELHVKINGKWTKFSRHLCDWCTSELNTFLTKVKR